MKITRIPLLLLGLAYGGIINTCLLGLGYGIYAFCATIAAIGGALAESNLDGCFNGDDEVSKIIGAIVGVAILAIIVGAATIGFAGGILYGFLTGSWHCGMDFYNNGILRGLSSPFRFLSARWNYDIKNSTTDLQAYYESTRTDFWAEGQIKAKHCVEKRSEEIHIAINKEVAPKVFPARISQLIAALEVSPDEMDVSTAADTVSQITDQVENFSFSQSVNAHRHLKVSDFYTTDQAASIINDHAFFSESKGHAAKTTAPKFPSAKETLRMLRNHRW